MANQPIEKTFCTTKEAADLLGVSVGTVQIWVERGLLEAWKTDGGHRRVLRDSVQKLLHQQPVLASTPLALIDASALEKQTRRLRVLAIDDEPDLLRLYTAKMARWEMAPEVNVCLSAVAGLIRIGNTRPDLLLMDLQMPGMDGFLLLRVLVKMPEIEGTTIVVVTGLDATSVAQRGGVPAGVEVLRKPVSFEHLHEIATRIVDEKNLGGGAV
jgi:excisionase family DNA binding protein